jgi:hypothetical protein
MQRRMVAVLVLSGIGLAGGFGGRLMRQGAPPRPRPAAVERKGDARPLKVASEACPVVGMHPEVGCDILASSGD